MPIASAKNGSCSATRHQASVSSRITCSRFEQQRCRVGLPTAQLAGLQDGRQVVERLRHVLQRFPGLLQILQIFLPDRTSFSAHLPAVVAAFRPSVLIASASRDRET